MNIYLFELKSLRKNAIIWICALIGLAGLYLSIYPSIANDVTDFKKLLGNYPPAVRAMLGINLDTLASLTGYYSMVISFVLLCGAIQAMNLGVSILSKESRHRTADFLLVKPVSRSTIIRSKLLAIFTIIVITNIIFCTTSFAMANAASHDYNKKLFLLINLTLFFLQLIFAALGFVISVFFQKLKNVLPISLGTVFGFYFIGALLAVGKDGADFRFISPFRYFDINYITKHNGYEASYLILSAAIIIISLVVTFVIYNKKDIHAV